MVLPSLPYEIWLQVLEDARLNLQDLARCCLVSKTFRLVALPRLYHTVDIRLVRPHDRTAASGPLAFNLPFAWSATQTSNLLALTLFDSPELASLPRSLEFGFGPVRMREIFEGFGAALQKLLKALPRVHELKLYNFTDEQLLDIFPALEREGGKIDTFRGFGGETIFNANAASKILWAVSPIKELHLTGVLDKALPLAAPPPLKALVNLELDTVLTPGILSLVSEASGNITRLCGLNLSHNISSAVSDLSPFTALLHFDWGYAFYSARDFKNLINHSSQHLRSLQAIRTLSLSFVRLDPSSPKEDLDDARFSTFFSAFPSTVEKVTLRIPTWLWKLGIRFISDDGWCPRLRRVICEAKKWEGEDVVEAVQEACEKRGIRVEFIARTYGF
ncbi:hypothetical protein MNV49_006970 [Pseudohyphozyma bogoriensis]|nr:hypothetical protein MNV49_006970 [Pseudohyphozyma bogoriensis]